MDNALPNESRTIKLPSWFKQVFRRLRNLSDTRRDLTQELTRYQNEINNWEESIESWVRTEHPQFSDEDFLWRLTEPEDEKSTVIELSPPLEMSPEERIEAHVLETIGLGPVMIHNFIYMKRTINESRRGLGEEPETSS